MAHVLIPPLPSNRRKLDYVPVERGLRTRQRQTEARGKAWAGGTIRAPRISYKRCQARLRTTGAVHMRPERGRG